MFKSRFIWLAILIALLQTKAFSQTVSITGSPSPETGGRVSFPGDYGEPHAMGWDDPDRFPARRNSATDSPGTISPTRRKRINDWTWNCFFNTSKPMKSAYELAMERSDDGDGKPLTDEQKEQIAEIDSKYKAKIAERKIVLEKSVQDAIAQGKHEEADTISRQLADEIAGLEDKAEAEKEKIRNKS